MAAQVEKKPRGRPPKNKDPLGAEEMPEAVVATPAGDAEAKNQELQQKLEMTTEHLRNAHAENVDMRKRLQQLEQQMAAMQIQNKELEKLVIDNLLANLNLKNTEEIDNFMKVNQISFSDISLKYKVDLFWNKMIYDKYVSKISINKNELRNRILSQTNSDFIEEYFLSEILFEINENENFKNKHNKIVNSIKNENFKVAAGNFSISNSALKGGEIGWVKKTQLSQKILDKINNLDIGDITEPFAVGNGFLIIKIVDKKKTKIKIDVDKELQNLIEKETDKQLALYSSNLFKIIKNNTYINEQ